MQAEFFRVDDRALVVGTARLAGGSVSIEAADGRSRDVLTRIFHPAPVLVDDPSFRSAGTSGPAEFQPGSLRWFQAAARARSAGEGLGVRFVPEQDTAMGWDPAGAYRTFGEAYLRRVRLGTPGAAGQSETAPEPGGPGAAEPSST